MRRPLVRMMRGARSPPTPPAGSAGAEPVGAHAAADGAAPPAPGDRPVAGGVATSSSVRDPAASPAHDLGRLAQEEVKAAAPQRARYGRSGRRPCARWRLPPVRRPSLGAGARGGRRRGPSGGRGASGGRCPGRPRGGTGLPHARSPTRKAWYGQCSPVTSHTASGGRAVMASRCRSMAVTRRGSPVKRGSSSASGRRARGVLPNSGAPCRARTVPPATWANSWPPRQMPRTGAPVSRAWATSARVGASQGARSSSSGRHPPPRTRRARCPRRAGGSAPA